MALLTGYYFSTASRDLGELGGDSATYVLLAKALAQGDGYRDIYLSGAPPHILWPPLLPLLLTPLVFLLGMNFLAMHFFVQICSGLTLVLIYYYFRPLHGSKVAYLIMLLFGAHPFWLSFQTRIASEMPFLVLVFAALFALRRYRQSPKVVSLSFGAVVIIGSLAFLTRSIGIALVMALGASLIWDEGQGGRGLKWKKAAASVGLLLIPVLAWEGWVLTYQGRDQRSYFDSLLREDYQSPVSEQVGLKEYAPRVFDNLNFYFKRLGQIILVPTGLLPSQRFLRYALKWLAIPFSLFALFGWFRGMRHAQDRTPEWLLLATLGLLVIWTTHSARHLLPIFPFLFHSLFRGLDGLFRTMKFRASEFRPAYAPTALLLVLAANSFISGDVIHTQHTPMIHRFTDPVPFQIDYSNFCVDTGEEPLNEEDRFLLLNAFVAQQAGPDDVILSRKPALTYLFAGRQAAFLLFQADDARQFQYLRQNRVRFVIADPRFLDRLQRYLLPTLAKYPQAFRVSYRFPDGNGFVLELLPENFPSLPGHD